MPQPLNNSNNYQNTPTMDYMEKKIDPNELIQEYYALQRSIKSGNYTPDMDNRIKEIKNWFVENTPFPTTKPNFPINNPTIQELKEKGNSILEKIGEHIDSVYSKKPKIPAAPLPGFVTSSKEKTTSFQDGGKNNADVPGRARNNMWQNGFDPDYIVQKGDTLWSISQKLGIPFQELIALNPHIYDINKINPGDGINFSHLPADAASLYSLYYGYNPANKEDAAAMALRHNALADSGWGYPIANVGNFYPSKTAASISLTDIEPERSVYYGPKTKPAKEKKGGCLKRIK